MTNPDRLVRLILAAVILAASDGALCQDGTANPAANRGGQGNGTTQLVPAADTAPASPRPDPKRALHESEAADKVLRDGIRREIETNTNRIKQCMAENGGCAANWAFAKLFLGLTRSEVEALLGPPQYHLHVGANHHYYWTLQLKSNPAVGPVRLRLDFGDCYYREKNSRKKAVCEAEVH